MVAPSERVRLVGDRRFSLFFLFFLNRVSGGFWGGLGAPKGHRNRSKSRKIMKKGGSKRTLGFFMFLESFLRVSETRGPLKLMTPTMKFKVFQICHRSSSGLVLALQKSLKLVQNAPRMVPMALPGRA